MELPSDVQTSKSAQLVVGVTPPVEAEAPSEFRFSNQSPYAPKPKRGKIEVFLQKLAAETPGQLDCYLVDILAHALRFDGRDGADVDSTGDAAISALVKRGASISEENKQKLLSAAAAYGKEMREYASGYQDHGDSDWVEAAYYNGEMERKLTERLATVPVKT